MWAGAWCVVTRRGAAASARVLEEFWGDLGHSEVSDQLRRVVRDGDCPYSWEGSASLRSSGEDRREAC
jgi:hypothetical protein